MTRLGPMLLVAFLLAGTAVAFGVTQGLKQEKAPIYAVVFSQRFGPHRPAKLQFRLRKADRITATVVDSSSRAVRTLVNDQRWGRKVTLQWGGQTENHVLLPEGAYRLHVHLARTGTTIEIPTVFVLDTTPPTLAGVRVSPRALTPGRHVVIRYRTDEPGQVILRVDGRIAVVTRKRARARPFTWNGMIGGKPVQYGRHVLQLKAVDLVGNRSKPSHPISVLVRKAAP